MEADLDWEALLRESTPAPEGRTSAETFCLITQDGINHGQAVEGFPETRFSGTDIDYMFTLPSNYTAILDGPDNTVDWGLFSGQDTDSNSWQ